MDTGEYKGVGEAVTRRADVRFVGATNADDSSFRHDFLARFVSRVRLPPLRERPEDIPLLIRHFLLRHFAETPADAKRFGRIGPDGRLEPNVSVGLVDELVRRPFPTNARELERVLLEAVNTSEGTKVRLPASKAAPGAPPKGFSSPVAGSAPGVPGSARSGVPTREEILACLKQYEGNVALVARRLGIERKKLYRLMKKYGIERKPPEE